MADNTTVEQQTINTTTTNTENLQVTGYITIPISNLNSTHNNGEIWIERG